MSWSQNECPHGHPLAVHSTELWREGEQAIPPPETPVAGAVRTVERRRGHWAAKDGDGWCPMCEAQDWTTATVVPLPVVSLDPTLVGRA